VVALLGISHFVRYTALLPLPIFSPTMARTKGSVNYKYDVLINIINELLPNGEVAWEAVCTAYFTQSKEKALRNTTDVMKHWIENLCNNMQKPTGRTGENGDRIHQCMLIEKKNYEENSFGGYWPFVGFRQFVVQ
jgi:hypothetical protein